MINRDILTGGFRGAGTPSQWGALTGVRPAKLLTRLLDGGLSPEEAVKSFMELGVSEKRARLCLSAAGFSRAVREELAPGDILLYVGIPFCPTRCTYCSFVSNSMPGALKLVGPYIEQLFREIEYAGEKMRGSGLRIRAVYIGGGTPTTLDADALDALMSALASAFDLSAAEEYTVEAGRPDTVTDEKLRTLKARGAGRISINPQTMHQSVLDAIGRRHTPEDVISAFAAARRAGFERVNADLIAGLPGDSPALFAESLERVMGLEPENLTVHTLAVKRGSTINELGAGLPDAEQVGAMLDAAAGALTAGGYAPYYLYRQKNSAGGLENTGWTRPGCRSLYNVAAMEELCGVLALGGGGVSKMRDAGGFIAREFDPKYPYEYNCSWDKIQKSKDSFFGFYAERGAL